MAKYRVVKKCLLRLSGTNSARICEVGEVVNFDAEPGSCLAPLDRAAEDRYLSWYNGKPKNVLKAFRDHREIASRVAAIKAKHAGA